MTWLLAGVLLGLAGSAHCAGMCGPLLLVLRGGDGSTPFDGWRRTFTYHGARVTMYVLLAIPAGYAGRALTAGNLGRAVGIVAGALLLIGATGASTARWTRPVSRAWSAALIRAGANAARLTRRRPQLGYAVLGVVNGLLPCGLVYAAATAASATGTMAGAALFMGGFGIGTIPALLAVTVSAAAVPASLRRRLRFAGPAVMALAGVLLIARALTADAAGIHQHGPHLRQATGIFTLR
jgi:uncharacterized protein